MSDWGSCRCGHALSHEQSVFQNSVFQNSIKAAPKLITNDIRNGSESVNQN